MREKLTEFRKQFLGAKRSTQKSFAQFGKKHKNKQHKTKNIMFFVFIIILFIFKLQFSLFSFESSGNSKTFVSIFAKSLKKLG